MTIKQIFQLGIELGVNADPRGIKGVKKFLETEREKYRQLSQDDKALFDRERLTNPYSDSRLHFGDPDAKVKTVLAGIEAEEAEIALVKALNLKIDLIITHHPVGRALAAMDEVMKMQTDLMNSAGVPINVAEGVMSERIKQVSRGLAPMNHFRAVDASRLAQIPLLNLHTSVDNLVFQFLQKLFNRKNPETLGAIIAILKKVTEYKIAAINGAGPRIFVGAPENRAGKILCFDITGGTEGAKELYPELAKAGVGTIIGMHMKEECREEAAKAHLNVVIAGHLSSDSLGLNLFLDRLAQKNIKIIPCSGLIRVRRK